jgi:adenylosuccinate lyase
MFKNLNLTRGLVFSQTVLLKIINKGVTREDAYKLVQSSAMKVWADENKNLKDELLASKDVMKLLDKQEIDDIFNTDKMLQQVDYIFNRSVNAD